MGLYINPVLSNRDYGVFRVGGPGLANCMFVAARAAVLSKKLGVPMLRPTWERFGIGQWIRRERDKRFYSGLFKGSHLIDGMKKFALMLSQRHVAESDAMIAKHGIIDVCGLGNYFEDFFGCANEVRQYFKDSILPQAIKRVPAGKQDVAAIHVRLGDFPEQYRTDIEWYVKVVKIVAAQAEKLGIQKFWLFSDGTDDELNALTTLPNVTRAYFGNALADMVAISRCRMLIGSDSTFSGWGAFLGDIPGVFAHVHYGRILENRNRERISCNLEEIESWLASGVIA